MYKRMSELWGLENTCYCSRQKFIEVSVIQFLNTYRLGGYRPNLYVLASVFFSPYKDKPLIYYWELFG